MKRHSLLSDMSKNPSDHSILFHQGNVSTLSLSPRRPGTASTTATATRARRPPRFQHVDESSSFLSHGHGNEEDDATAPFTLVDRMRNWRNDAMTQHLYSTAEFWGSKVFNLTSMYWWASVNICPKLTLSLRQPGRRVLAGSNSLSYAPIWTG